MIPSEYIYDVFWIICLFINFVVVVFPIFGASEDFRGLQRPNVLDIKRKYPDINGVKGTNIPKFSKLDNRVTSIRPLELLLVVMIVGYTKFCSHREKADIIFEIY